MTTTPPPEGTEVREFVVDADLPHLVVPCPECSHCGTEVTFEDGAAFCPRCIVVFDRIEDGATGVPDPNEDGSDVACEVGPRMAQREPYDHGGKLWELGPLQPCILPSGHEGDHLHPYTVTVTPLAVSR